MTSNKLISEIDNIRKSWCHGDGGTLWVKKIDAGLVTIGLERGDFALHEDADPPIGKQHRAQYVFW